MKITTELLKKFSACQEGFKWVTRNKLIDLESFEFVSKLIASKKYEWANWLYCKIFTKEQFRKYICFAYDKWIEYIGIKYPKDTNSKPLFESMKALVNDPNDNNYKAFNDLRINYRARADRADRADLADRAYLADLAYRAYLADLADLAYRADLAKMQKEIVEFGLTLLEK